MGRPCTLVVTDNVCSEWATCPSNNGEHAWSYMYQATALDTSCKHQEVDAENLEYFGEKLMDFYRSFADL